MARLAAGLVWRRMRPGARRKPHQSAEKLAVVAAIATAIAVKFFKFPPQRVEGASTFILLFFVLMSTIYNLFVINKSGGLIYYKDYGSIDTNDSLRLASLWHSMHAISQQLSPTSGCTGIELLEADTFGFQSLTGIEVLLKTIYELYTDYVLKNPFMR